MFVKKNILGVDFTDATFAQVLEYLTKKLSSEADKFYVVTPNPELVVIANKDKNYQKILNNAEISLPDGVGVLLAGKILGKSLKERITGVDLVEKLSERIAKRGVTAAFLGGRPGVAVRAAECLKKRYFGLKITFSGPEITNFKDFPKTDILFVAFGSPKQEIWISNNLKKFPIKAAIGVGGAFDMISGEMPRAPRVLRDNGLEWLYRLIRQPWRAKRQISLLQFIFLVLRQRVGL